MAKLPFMPRRGKSARPGVRALGLPAGGPVEIARQVRAGFSFRRLSTFQKISQLPWETVSRFVAIPQRTLTRRQTEGRLQPDESDRVWRASAIFDRAVDLFDGDVAAARHWLLVPQKGLGGAVPLEFASTDVGAREVEDLIGRLEHGVFT